MRYFIRYNATWVAIALTVTGCTLASPETSVAPSPPANFPIPAPTNPSPSPLQKTLAVKMYSPDPLCETLVSEFVQVPRQQALQSTIDLIIQYSTTSDFRIAGYRIQPNPENHTLTLDLRLSPQSQRLFVSLSSCERFTLFGSLRETLIQHQDWQIKDVIFTDRGKPISF